VTRILTKLRINEISSVDRGAGDGCRIMLAKRDDDAFEEPEKDDVIDDDLAVADDEPDAPKKLRQFVEALRIANPKLTEQQAHYFLLHHPAGQMLSRHLAEVTKMKDAQPMDQLRSFVKGNGVIGIAKHIVAKGSTAITEHEFSDLIMEAAKREKRAGESDAAAFSRFFAAPENADVRKAHALTKSMMPIEPVYVGGKDASDVNTDNSKAYQQMVALAEEMRRRSPYLTVAQAFARVFTNPENAELANKAHMRPAPTTNYRHPR
jgi:hypothetical protein